MNRRVLNVGGGGKHIPIPKWYEGWEHLILDIDATLKPDVLMDARELLNLPAGQYDAVYCAHNLEHYHPHETEKVLRGFWHVLKSDGFAEIRVPDLMELMRRVVAGGIDLEDVLYTSDAGPITPRDVLYGYGPEIAKTGNDFYAHKGGFSQRSLGALLTRCGFSACYIAKGNDLEILAFAFKRETPPQRLAELIGNAPRADGR